jgi:hypothetical protein
MKKFICFLSLVSAIVFYVGATPLPDGQFVDLGSSTLDKNTQLEWLSLSTTRGMSPCEVEADLADSNTYLCNAMPGGDASHLNSVVSHIDGWRFASYDDVFTLFDNWFGVLNFTYPIVPGAQAEQYSSRPLLHRDQVARLNSLSRHLGGVSYAHGSSEMHTTSVIHGFTNMADNGAANMVSDGARSFQMKVEHDLSKSENETPALYIAKTSTVSADESAGAWLVRDYKAVRPVTSQTTNVSAPITIGIILLAFAAWRRRQH